MDCSSPTTLPTAVQIGGLRIEPNLVLAPMEGVTDLSFRRMVRHIGGVGLTCTEFVPSAALKRGDDKFTKMVAFDEDERPISIQLYGKDPAEMAAGARVVQELGADICDINMGCPSKKVCNNSGGSALMREPELVRDIVRAVVAAVDIPVTVKMRSGFDADNRNAPEIAWIAQEEGAQWVAIHWRTREDKYKGTRAIDKIAETKAKLRIPVLANGDIVDIDSARAMFQDTGCDGLLIGRGAIRNPWLPLQISEWQQGLPITVVNAAERERVMIDYFDSISAVFARSAKGALGRFKMLANQYSRGLPAGVQFKKKVLHSLTGEEARAHVAEYFQKLRQYEAGDEGVFEDYKAKAWVRKQQAG